MSAPSTPAGFERFRAGRDAIMEEGNQAKQQAIKLDRSANESDQIMAGEYWWARHAASDKYRALLPNVAVSRCPFSGELLTWALDTVDLDGWAWNYDATVRRMPKPPKYFLAFTGAMRLHEPVTSKAIHVEPGPGVPGVIPHLFDWPNTIGVIAQIDVGPHIGWPIVYYTSSQPAKPGGYYLGYNFWAEDDYSVHDGTGEWVGWGARRAFTPDYDFELEPWLDSGQLQWIQPGDDTMTLHQGSTGCPYLNLDGPRKLPTIRHGKIEYGPGYPD
ncbi:hypothetical protein GCM10023321_74700 [Pseudonocardia eucalypti]|uniref:DUF427 domain-containing protein n=1 Tax=Pseudonocardia eucalypti TaxID=648755 RepID=A0ABP9RA39_9PSEU|nr:hypothetical protein [Pseudonocardia eucalypti]